MADTRRGSATCDAQGIRRNRKLFALRGLVEIIVSDPIYSWCTLSGCLYGSFFPAVGTARVPTYAGYHFGLGVIDEFRNQTRNSARLGTNCLIKIAYNAAIWKIPKQLTVFVDNLKRGFAVPHVLVQRVTAGHPT